MQKMRMTLHCVQCGAAYMRSGDLILHMQTAHSAMWAQAQAMTRFLLKVLMPLHNCVCNPSVHKVTLTHVCPFYRQMAMLAGRSAVELFLPWKSSREGLEQRLQHSLMQTAFAPLVEAVHHRQVRLLLHDPALQAFLRERCVLCGGVFHPALLRDHILQVHNSNLERVTDLLPFLYDVFTKEAHTDHQCAQCHQIFNLPLLGDPNLTEQLARQTLVLAHYQQCPVVHQVCLLLQDGNPRDTQPDGSRNAGASGHLCGDGTSSQEVFPEAKNEERDSKKAKTRHQPLAEDQDINLPQVVLQMARLVIKMDADQSLLRKQDSFVFYMQMEEESVIHVLSAKAHVWHQEMAAQDGQMKTQQWKPLRVTLMQTLAETLQHRLLKLYNCKSSDPLFQTALQHNLVNAQGEFYFQKWDAAAQKLVQTDQPPVAMDRMKRFVDQLVEILAEPANVVKFHALKANGDQRITPWILQISLRCDELQTLLEQLTGSKIWNLLGATLKAHSLPQSSQAEKLKTLLGKGKSSGKGKHHKRWFQWLTQTVLPCWWPWEAWLWAMRAIIATSMPQWWRLCG